MVGQWMRGVVGGWMVDDNWVMGDGWVDDGGWVGGGMGCSADRPVVVGLVGGAELSHGGWPGRRLGVTPPPT